MTRSVRSVIPANAPPRSWLDLAACRGVDPELFFPMSTTERVGQVHEALAICVDAGVPCGHPHVDANNVEQLVEKGFRWLMPAPSQSFAALEKGLKAAGRK